MDSRDEFPDKQMRMGQEMEGSEEIQVLKDAEAYYSSMINSREEEIIQMLGKDTKILDEIMEEMKELDKNYNQLKNDLKDDIANDEIIEAMVQNYRMKLFILEDILNQLQKTNTQKDEEVNKVRL
jgi:flagellar biosynthesis chaperone FliJ